MDDEQQLNPWYTRWWAILAIFPLIVGLVVGFVVVIFEYGVVKPVENQPPSAMFDRLRDLILGITPWVLGVVLLIWLVNSFIQPTGRARWRRVREWVAGLRARTPLTTAAGRRFVARQNAEKIRDMKNHKFNEGYSQRTAEVERERRSLRKPAWRVDRKSDGANVLYNWGFPVSDVKLSAQQDEFVLEGAPPWWRGTFGSNNYSIDGKYFEGHPTPKGASEGVNFSVSYADAHGNMYEDTWHERLKSDDAPDQTAS